MALWSIVKIFDHSQDLLSNEKLIIWWTIQNHEKEDDEMLKMT